VYVASTFQKLSQTQLWGTDAAYTDSVDDGNVMQDDGQLWRSS